MPGFFIQIWETVSFWEKLLFIGVVLIVISIFIRFFSERFGRKQMLQQIDTFIGDVKGDETKKMDTSDQHEIHKKTWQNFEITAFFETYVAPHELLLKEFKAYEAIVRLLELLDAEGHCPSIASRYQTTTRSNGGGDTEANQWHANQKNAYAILFHHVTLMTHTLNVARILIETRKKESKDFHMEMGRLLLAALGHDIGKIPTQEKRSQGRDHFLISHEMMSRILPAGYSSRDEILKAIRDHHFPGAASGTLLASLKDADHRARQMELETYGGAETCVESKPVQDKDESSNIGPKKRKYKYELVDLSWLDISDLMQRIGKRVNLVENGRFEAFSHEGIIYVYPRLIAKCACDLAARAGRLEITAYMANEGKLTDLEFALRQALGDYIPERMIGETFIGRKFRIRTRDCKFLNPGFYLPIEISAFNPGTIERFENMKQNYCFLRSIRKVEAFQEFGS